MHILRPTVTIAMLALCLTGCRRDQPSPQPTPPPTPIAVDDRIVSTDTTFAFALFAELIGEAPSGNVFISPSSVAIALAMAYNGAAGATRDAMSRALALQDMTIDEVNQANSDLLASLRQAEPAVTLSIANSLWAREGAEFKPPFLAANEDFYGAEVTALDFTSPSAVDTMNAWVSDETRGKIPSIIQGPINKLAILFLINATYSKGQWVDKFSEGQTEDRPFTLLDGSAKPLPMMHQYGDYDYHHGDDYQAIALPYVGDRMSMYIVLPDEDSSLAAFLETLDAEQWAAVLQQLSEQEGTIALPRFTVEYDVLLNDALAALGMGVVFDQGNADFTEMADIAGPIWIQQVKHKTFVEVNEEGTEAAAVTVEEFGGETAMPTEPFDMVVDRPFFCAIRDNQTGTLLFMGAITDPE